MEADPCQPSYFSRKGGALSQEGDSPEDRLGISVTAVAVIDIFSGHSGLEQTHPR